MTERAQKLVRDFLSLMANSGLTDEEMFPVLREIENIVHGIAGRIERSQTNPSRIRDGSETH